MRQRGSLARAAVVLDEAGIQRGSKRKDRGGAEVGAAPAFQLLERLVQAHRVAVDALRRHGVECVRDVDDPCGQGNGVARETVRITLAVRALVVVPDRRNHVLEVAQLRDDPRALLRMAAHQQPLGLVERAVLQEHTVRDSDLADVVQQRRLAERLELRGRELELRAHRDRQIADAARVAGRVRVARVDGRGERLERRRRPLDDDLARFHEPVVLLVNRLGRDLELVGCALREVDESERRECERGQRVAVPSRTPRTGRPSLRGRARARDRRRGTARSRARSGRDPAESIPARRTRLTPTKTNTATIPTRAARLPKPALIGTARAASAAHPPAST